MLWVNFSVHKNSSVSTSIPSLRYSPKTSQTNGIKISLNSLVIPVQSTRAGSRMLVWRKPLSFRLLNLIISSGVNMSSFFRLHCCWRRFVEHHLMVTLPFLHPLMASLIRVVRALRTTLTPFGLLESGEECFLHFPAQHRQPNFFQLLLLCKTKYFLVFLRSIILILRNNLQVRREKRDCELEIILVVLGVELSSQCMGIYRGRRASGEHPNVGVGRPPHKHNVSKFWIMAGNLATYMNYFPEISQCRDRLTPTLSTLAL